MLGNEAQAEDAKNRIATPQLLRVITVKSGALRGLALPSKAGPTNSHQWLVNYLSTLRNRLLH